MHTDHWITPQLQSDARKNSVPNLFFKNPKSLKLKLNLSSSEIPILGKI